MTAQAAILLAKQGVSKYKLHSVLINYWDIDDGYQELLEEYFLLKWEGRHAREAVQGGRIVRNGVSYSVVFHNCTPAKVGRSNYVMLSFRKARDIPIAYVLVKLFLKD